ncbi:DUF429 domain-containing protein [Methanobacterium alcaliphilum]|uniref:DUF429 domain-containing protein n=1 Tax=Methanobacterium alcaliphilum TaxID=392018 RepID=UPI00200AB2E8|nr:DUF429 domain-containing protein [Methanobacterium alcaliphilum]MCK9151501.1 DUF429 domain-containing protein [Methanobacterium alcaliphilum]
MILGIDLAAKCENSTGFAVIDKKTMFIGTVLPDSELLDIVDLYKPEFIAIDAPLSIPSGRCCLEKECKCSAYGHFRQSDKKMRQYGGVLPLTFHGMKLLTLRAIELKEKLKISHPSVKIIETHPRTCQKVFGLDKEVKNIFDHLNSFFQLQKFVKINKKINLKSWTEVTQHEIDGALAALSALYYVNGKFHELGDPGEGTIIVPDVCNGFKSDISSFLNDES